VCCLPSLYMCAGIPSIYYGTEQGINGAHGWYADKRPPLWHSGYGHDHPLWLFLKMSIAYRKAGRVWDGGVAQQHYVSSTTLVLSRGVFVLMLTNVPEWDAQRRGPVGMVTLQGPLPARFSGKTLTNIYNPAVSCSVSAVGCASPEQGQHVPQALLSMCSMPWLHGSFVCTAYLLNTWCL